MLGLTISNDLKWTEHIENILAKANKRLHFLRILKKSGLETSDLKIFYISVVRPVMEYCCQVWHPSIAFCQTTIDQLEHIQSRALKTMMPETDPEIALQILNLQSLYDRRVELCKRFFKQMSNPKHKLNKLLPEKHNHTYDTRNNESYKLPKCRTEKFKRSFIPYCLFKFQ